MTTTTTTTAAGVSAATAEAISAAAKASQPPGPRRVVVHPLVLLSVVDHYNRVAKGTSKRVVGMLLGQANGDVVNVANSFAVPFEEDEKNPGIWFLDHSYAEKMAHMFKKVNARELVVGWYHTGPKLAGSDLEINSVLRRLCANPSVPSVLVVVDVQQKKRASGQSSSVTEEIADTMMNIDIFGDGSNSGKDAAELPTEAYFSAVDVHNDGKANSETFFHIQSEIGAEEAEEIGVEHLLRDIKDEAAGSLSVRVTQRLNSLKGLQNRLSEIGSYLDDVVTGRLPNNQRVIQQLQNVLNLLPNLHLDVPLNLPVTKASKSTLNNDSSAASIEQVGGGISSEANSAVKTFASRTNDHYLIMYIASLVRTVIGLHDLIDNKLQNIEKKSTSADDESTKTKESAAEPKK
ncbi:Mov34-domain-containing protein [Ramicandelaber brevisporus]|nr:Mov34-domain-containing protein [Ramicandelaber brevisporus]